MSIISAKSFEFKSGKDCLNFLTGLGAMARNQFYKGKESNILYNKHGVGGLSFKPSALEWVEKFKKEGLLTINK